MARALGTAAALAALVPAIGARPAAAAADRPFAGTPRGSWPVVVNGSALPTWSRLPAVGQANPLPGPALGNLRSTHNGTIVVPPDARAGIDPDQVAAYRYDPATGGWTEVPVQVDQRFPNFLVNGRSSFGIYSGTDVELTYAWKPDAHTVGEEAWKKVFGDCSARFGTPAEVATSPLVTPGTGETRADWATSAADPVPTLDDDDEVVVDGSDFGVEAPTGTAAPAGVADPTTGQVLRAVDPAGGATGGATGVVYLFLTPGGSSFTAATGHVRHARAAGADAFLDRRSFNDDDPQKLGTSNTGYGANLPGTVCSRASRDANPSDLSSTDRFPADAMTISTDTYKATATGRWMVRGYQVAQPGLPGVYGPDLIDRWKGRAFQQSPDSSVSVVGFEDEQVNWEANSALLGWRSGPVRTIREVWGADSGTNVTKTESWYRAADTFRYHLRVHPIPSDGLYTSWDYNKDAVGTYFTTLKPNGVPIDGVNDDTGNVDSIPVAGEPAFFDVPDPTFDLTSAFLRPEQVAGKGSNGGVVYTFEALGATSFTEPAVVPYYRDDACLDDGTGDDPVGRPYPGEASTDERVKAGYAASNGKPYAQLACDPANGKTPFQGAFGSHGIHFFATSDTDNAFLPTTTTEVDGQQWRFPVPMSQPTNVLAPYGQNVQLKLLATATPFTGDASDPTPAVPELPLPALFVGAAAVASVLLLRRRGGQPR